MKKTLIELRWMGEPAYEEWTNNGSVLEFSSRETRKVPGGGWKLVRTPVLHRAAIDVRWGPKRRVAAAAAARQYLITIPGVGVV